jgi:hypothetical protein
MGRVNPAVGLSRQTTKRNLALLMPTKKVKVVVVETEDHPQRIFQTKQLKKIKNWQNKRATNSCPFLFTQRVNYFIFTKDSFN